MPTPLLARRPDATHWTLHLLAWLCGIVLLLSLAPTLSAYTQADFTRDQSSAALAAQAVDKLKLDELFGPLGAVSLSPFFGLACLSFVAMGSQNGWMPANGFLEANPILGNPVIFTVLGGLALLTALPKLTKVSKPVSQVTDYLELYASVIAYGVILLASGQEISTLWSAAPAASVSGTPEPLQASILTLPLEFLLAAAIAINLVVINTVKLFFDLLIWLCPFPTVDALFEIGSKAACGALVALYAFSPWLATAVNVVMFLACLVVFNWANRRMAFYRATLADPPFRGLLSSLGFDNSRPDYREIARHGKTAPAGALVVKVFPNRRWQGVPKRGRCFLFITPGAAQLYYPRLFRPSLTRDLPAPQGWTLESSLLVNSLEIPAIAGQKEFKLHFSHLYDAQRAEIAHRLGAVWETSTEPGLPPSCAPAVP